MKGYVEIIMVNILHYVTSEPWWLGEARDSFSLRGIYIYPNFVENANFLKGKLFLFL